MYVGVRYIYFKKYSYTPGDLLINSSGRTIRTIAKYMHYVEHKRQNNEIVGSKPQQYYRRNLWCWCWSHSRPCPAACSSHNIVMALE